MVNNDVLYVNKTGGINQLDPLKDAEKYVVNINEKLTKLRAAKSKLMQLKGIPPTSIELAEEMKITKE